jgi:hypothetical protein
MDGQYRDMETKIKWKYEAGEHRVKHCWNEPRADFVRNGSNVIGKCPSTLSKEQAYLLLQDATYIRTEGITTQPSRMWNVHEGVIYEAVPTQAGSYHGYPWRGRPGMNRLSRQVLADLRRMAETKNCLREFNNWIKEHGER